MEYPWHEMEVLALTPLCPPTLVLAVLTLVGICEKSGISFCTGDFAPLTPEFGPEFWETNFGHPNFLDPNS